MVMMKIRNACSNLTSDSRVRLTSGLKAAHGITQPSTSPNRCSNLDHKSVNAVDDVIEVSKDLSGSSFQQQGQVLFRSSLPLIGE